MIQLDVSWTSRSGTFAATCLTLAALAFSGCALRLPTKATAGSAGPLSWTCESDDSCKVDRIDQGGQPRPLIGGSPITFSRPRQRPGGIVEARGRCGPSCAITFFADIRTQQISPPFVRAIASDSRRRIVAIPAQRSIRVLRIFGDLSQRGLELTRDFAPVNELTDAIIRGEFVDGPALKLTYLDAGSTRRTDTIKFDIAALPPVPIPLAVFVEGPFKPLRRLTKREIERQLRQLEVIPSQTFPGPLAGQSGAYRLTQVDLKVTDLFFNRDGTATANYRATERPTEIGYTVGKTKGDARVFVGWVVYRRYEDGWRHDRGHSQLAEDVRKALQPKPPAEQPR